MIKKHTCLFYFGIVILISSCSKTIQKNPLKRALASKDIRIKRVMDSLEQYEIQIRYTQIDRKNDSILFTDFDFQLNSNNYFYPASTVKLPASIAALEKLNEIDSLDRNSKFYIEGDSTETTFAKTIEAIFAVSDNSANNKLVEFLGFDNINARMQKRGIQPIRISHRLSTSNADDVTTKPLVLYLNDSTIATSKPIINKSATALTLNRIKKGKGFYEGDSLHQEPFDFSLKNYYPIISQHELLKRIIFPKNFPKKHCFNLSENQHDFLLNAMSTLPKDIGYDSKTFYDSYAKFFMYGDSKEPIPNNIKIYNKVGYAYGTLTDCAYIKDAKNNVDFMLTTTILVNKDSIYNNDNYEYDTIGIPFLAQLGRELYKISLESKN